MLFYDERQMNDEMQTTRPAFAFLFDPLSFVSVTMAKATANEKVVSGMLQLFRLNNDILCVCLTYV